MNKREIRGRYYTALAEGRSQADAVRFANGYPDKPAATRNDSPVDHPQPEAESLAADGMTTDDLRSAIKAATGKAPHWKTVRANLIEQFQALGKD